MDAAFNALFAATLSFVGGHFLLSSAALRPRLVALLGVQGFRAAYSVAALAAFVWMVKAYGAASGTPLWTPPEALAWVPLLVLPAAFVLLVCALTTPNPTMVAGERLLDGTPGPPAGGILTLTRHPFLWATALWAGSHLTVRGDAASLLLMGGILVLSLGGMHHIDRRREAALGSAWGPFALTTSVVPFAAIAGGRTRPDWAGIGWWRPALGLALYAALLLIHPWLTGVAVVPL